MPSDLQVFVDRLDCHSRLLEVERAALLGLPQRVFEVTENQEVVSIDEVVDHLTVVTEGVLARFGLSAEGDRHITSLAILGDAPDLHMVVLPSATAPLLSLTRSTAVRVPHSALRAIAARYPAIAEAFWRHCSIDASITAAWVANLSRHSARKRLCHLLCEMAVRLKADQQDSPVSFPLPITQAHLSAALGLSNVHVNRTLKFLAVVGIVTISRRTVEIPDWQKLVRAAEFNSSYLTTDFKPGERLRIVG